MLVNRITVRESRPHERLCLQDEAQERSEALRRLRRQLEQAQRDLERAENEHNHEAVIRLRYRIIPQLEERIRDLTHEACPSSTPVLTPTACSRESWQMYRSGRDMVSHTILPEHTIGGA